MVPFFLVNLFISDDKGGSYEGFALALLFWDTLRGFSSLVWGIVLITYVEQVRMTWLAGDMARILRVRGIGVTTLLLLANYAILKVFWIEGEDPVTSRQLQMLGLARLSTDFCLMCALLYSWPPGRWRGGIEMTFWSPSVPFVLPGDNN